MYILHLYLTQAWAPPVAGKLGVDFHLVGRLAGWANGVGGVCIGVTGLAVVVRFVWLATV